MRSLLAALVGGSLALALPGPARATGTTPLLALASASAAVADGARSVAVEGTFDFPDALQVGYPLELVVFQGTRFARFPVVGAPVTGDSPELADGALGAAEITAFLHEGTAAPAGVRLITLVADHARVSLPAGFTSGPASVLVFAVLSEGPVLSNVIVFSLP
jgi:hypothetical protein